MYLFLAIGFVLTVTIRGQLNLVEYGCTGDNDCVQLTNSIRAAMQGTPNEAFASLVTSKCSQQMGFCTISCATIDLCGQLAGFGISGLTCSGNKLCEADITCVNSDTECAFSGLAKCGTTAGVCIPDRSAECVDNSECTSLPGLGYCEATRLGGKDVRLCNKEPCCPAGTCSDSNCITSAHICQPSSGFCSVRCSTDDECNPVFARGLICNKGNGLCGSVAAPTKIIAPTRRPTNSPSRKPIDNGTPPSVTPPPIPTRMPIQPTLRPSVTRSPIPTRSQVWRIPDNNQCCDCISASEFAGCRGKRACEAIVCKKDPFCCWREWDTVCALKANAVCEGVETAKCCECTNHQNGYSGCLADIQCEIDVCETDPFCCNRHWDRQCANSAVDICLQQSKLQVE